MKQNRINAKRIPKETFILFHVRRADGLIMAFISTAAISDNYTIS